MGSGGKGRQEPRRVNPSDSNFRLRASSRLSERLIRPFFAGHDAVAAAGEHAAIQAQVNQALWPGADARS